MLGKKKIALVLGSGGARGWAHIGALQALRDIGVKPSFVAGTSIGSIAAAAVATGTLDEFAKLAQNLDWKQTARLFIELGVHRSGVTEGRHTMELLGGILPDVQIQDLPIPYEAVAMDIGTQQEMVFRSGRLLDAIRASISIPGVFTPEPYGDGVWLVDGGLVNPLPVSLAREAGRYRVVAVDINLNMSQSDKSVEDKAREIKTRRAKRRDNLATLFSRKSLSYTAESLKKSVRDFVSDLYGIKDEEDGKKPARNRPPSMFDVMVQSVRAAENSITRARLLREPPDVLIQPAVGHIGTLDFYRSEEAIKAGRLAVMKVADQLS